MWQNMFTIQELINIGVDVNDSDIFQELNTLIERGFSKEQIIQISGGFGVYYYNSDQLEPDMDQFDILLVLHQWIMEE